MSANKKFFLLEIDFNQISCFLVHLPIIFLFISYLVSKPSRMSLIDLAVLSHLSVTLRHSAPKNLKTREITILSKEVKTNLILGSTRRDSSIEALVETKRKKLS